jgi:hypothetical protein
MPDEVKEMTEGKEEETTFPLAEESVKEPVDPKTVDPETGELYPVCAECGERHPAIPEDEEDEGWYFYELVGSDRATEDRIWEAVRLLKKGGAGTKEMATVMRDEARKAMAAGNKAEAYLWPLITGKVFGLYGV